MKTIGWIKLHRSLKDWEWWDDHNTTRLLVYLLASVNYEDKKWKGTQIKAGSFITSWDKLSSECGLTIQEVRTAMKRLESCGEVVRKSTNKNQTISLVKWGKLQGESLTDNRPVTNKKQTSNKPVTTTKEGKEREEGKELPPDPQNPPSKGKTRKQPAARAQVLAPPEFSEFQSYALEHEPRIDLSSLRAKYDQWMENGWRDGFEKEIKNWKTKIRNTMPHLKKTDKNQSFMNNFKYDHSKRTDGETYVQRLIRNKIDPRDAVEVQRFLEEEGLDISRVALIRSHFDHTPEKFPYVQD